jgi:hypothetical protein
MNPSPSLTSPAPAFEFRVPARPKRRSIPSYPQTTSTSPIKPTSSLARRRRASLISASAAGNMLQRVVTDPGPHTADDDDEVMSQAAAIVAEPDEEATEFDSIEQAMVCPPPPPGIQNRADVRRHSSRYIPSPNNRSRLIGRTRKSS